MPICKNSRAAISLVTHCRLFDVESLLIIDRKGLCFDRLDIVGIVAGEAGASVGACCWCGKTALVPAPSDTAFFDVATMLLFFFGEYKESAGLLFEVATISPVIVTAAFADMAGGDDTDVIFAPLITMREIVSFYKYHWPLREITPPRAV